MRICPSISCGVLAAVVAAAAFTAPAPARAADPVKAPVAAAFGSACEDRVIEAIDGASNEIRMAAYSLTRRNITSALTRAADRGVRIMLKYDAKQAEYEPMRAALERLHGRKIRKAAITMTDEHASMHHKFLAIDQRWVVTGSYNYTSPASELNYENVVVIDSPAVARDFIREFDAIKSR